MNTSPQWQLVSPKEGRDLSLRFGSRVHPIPSAFALNSIMLTTIANSWRTWNKAQVPNIRVESRAPPRCIG